MCMSAFFFSVLVIGIFVGDFGLHYIGIMFSIMMRYEFYLCIFEETLPNLCLHCL